MDSADAHDQLSQIERAHRYASRPPVPWALGGFAALRAGGGVALVGQPSAPVWVHDLTCR